MGVVWLGSSEINPELGHFTGFIAEALSHWLSQARTSARKDAAFHMSRSFLVDMPAVRPGVWMNDNFYATSHVSYRCGLSLDMSHIPWPFSYCVGHIHKLCKNGFTNWDGVWGQTCEGLSNVIFDGGAHWHYLADTVEQSVSVMQLITTITVSTCLTSSLHIYSLHLFFRLPCSLVDQHLCRRLLAGKDSWSELYRHVVCVHMNRTPTGTFHSHNFDTVVTCLLRDTSKLLVCICWSYIWLLCDIWLFLSFSAEVFRRYCRMFVM